MFLNLSSFSYLKSISSPDIMTLPSLIYQFPTYGKFNLSLRHNGFTYYKWYIVMHALLRYLFLKNFFILFSVCESLFVHMFVSHMCIWCPWRSEEDTESPWSVDLTKRCHWDISLTSMCMSLSFSLWMHVFLNTQQQDKSIG